MVQAILRPYARAVAGSAITQAWNDATQTFTLAFTPVDGVTDVSLPARVYPGGYVITIVGACFDASTAGHLLVQPDGTSKPASLTIALSVPRDD